MDHKMKTRSGWCLAGIFALGLSGCSAPPASSGGVPPPAINMADYEKGAQLEPNAAAGVPVTPKADLDPKLANLVAGLGFSSRSDPFGLLAAERNYEASQNAERLVQSSGGFLTEWDGPKPEVPEILEPQPYRRLAGVMVGDSVLALIDMGDGKLQLISPGEKIGETEWTVVSIDTDKAVLRRSGNKKPKEVVVGLMAPLDPLTSSAGSGGGGNRGGGPPSMGPPPGGPGGPGGKDDRGGPGDEPPGP